MVTFVERSTSRSKGRSTIARAVRRALGPHAGDELTPACALAIAILALLCGANRLVPMEESGTARAAWLKWILHGRRAAPRTTPSGVYSPP
jgi:hypothetical protein